MELNKHTNAQKDLIYGTWYLRNYGIWLLQREFDHPIYVQSDDGEWVPSQTDGYCQFRFDFHENGELVEGYAAPCWNDMLFHHWTGNWRFGKDWRTLILQIENYPVFSSFNKLRPSEAYKKGQEFHIIEITKGEMQLQPQDTEVQRAAEVLWEYDRQESY